MNKNDRHPEVAPRQREMARFNSLLGIVLSFLGAWYGWERGTEYLKPLAERWNLPLEKVDFVQTVPYLEIPIHVNDVLLFRLTGVILGVLAVSVIGTVVELCLKRAGMLPAPIPRAIDEMIDDDWTLEFQPESEEPPQSLVAEERAPERGAVVREIPIEHETGAPANIRAKVAEFRDFMSRYLWRREGFDVTIHCRNSFLFRSLRRKYVPEKALYRIERKEDETFVHDLEVVDYAEARVVENGYTVWMTSPGGITPWQMACETEGDTLTLSFRLHKGFVVVFWGIAGIGFIVPLVLLAPALWIVPVVLLAILLGNLWGDPQKAERTFTRRLRRIEQAYEESAAPRRKRHTQ